MHYRWIFGKEKRNILCMIKSAYNPCSTYACIENDDGYSMKKTENMSGTQTHDTIILIAE